MSGRFSHAFRLLALLTALLTVGCGPISSGSPKHPRSAIRFQPLQEDQIEVEIKLNLPSGVSPSGYVHLHWVGLYHYRPDNKRSNKSGVFEVFLPLAEANGARARLWRPRRPAAIAVDYVAFPKSMYPDGDHVSDAGMHDMIQAIPAVVPEPSLPPLASMLTRVNPPVEQLMWDPDDERYNNPRKAVTLNFRRTWIPVKLPESLGEIKVVHAMDWDPYAAYGAPPYPHGPPKEFFRTYKAGQSIQQWLQQLENYLRPNAFGTDFQPSLDEVVTRIPVDQLLRESIQPDPAEIGLEWTEPQNWMPEQRHPFWRRTVLVGEDNSLWYRFSPVGWRLFPVVVELVDGRVFAFHGDDAPPDANVLQPKLLWLAGPVGVDWQVEIESGLSRLGPQESSYWLEWGGARSSFIMQSYRRPRDHLGMPFPHVEPSEWERENGGAWREYGGVRVHWKADRPGAKEARESLPKVIQVFDSGQMLVVGLEMKGWLNFWQESGMQGEGTSQSLPVVLEVIRVATEQTPGLMKLTEDTEED